MCVALLIAAEFMPASLLTPIASDLAATSGMAGQAISISGLFAVLTSLLIAPAAGRFDRRAVLLVLTVSMLASVVLIALAPTFVVLMVARAFLGIAVGGFWALSTATVMRLVPRKQLPRAMGVLYMGNAVATAVAAPAGSFLGGIIGWRGVFWLLVPLAVLNLLWQWISLPTMRPQGAVSLRRVIGLLRRGHVARAMVAVMLSFGGAFAVFTYLRPFLETHVHATLSEISLLLLGLGVAGFAGTFLATALVRRHLQRLLAVLPLGLAAVTVAMLALAPSIWLTALTMIAWGGLNAAIPVVWSNWLAESLGDDAEAGGGLLIAAIQLSIMLGAALGGCLLDLFSISATFGAGATLLVLAAGAVRSGHRPQPLSVH
ncbi:MAG: putative transporter [Polaromonas sp.]|nr:putative transporter [Polaromonas sp.]